MVSYTGRICKKQKRLTSIQSKQYLTTHTVDNGSYRTKLLTFDHELQLTNRFNCTLVRMLTLLSSSHNRHILSSRNPEVPPLRQRLLHYQHPPNLRHLRLVSHLPVSKRPQTRHPPHRDRPTWRPWKNGSVGRLRR